MNNSVNDDSAAGNEIGMVYDNNIIIIMLNVDLSIRACSIITGFACSHVFFRVRIDFRLPIILICEQRFRLHFRRVSKDYP